MGATETSDVPATRTVAAIDIGANAVRMVIAEVLPEGGTDVIERLQRAVRLGQDTFRRGRLGGQSMRAAVAVLRDFRQALDLYQVKHIRAVATNAVREASNVDIFLNRILMATGLDVEVIAASEQSRLTVSAVMESVGSALEVDRGKSLFAEVGGGSTMLTLLQDGEIITAQSLRLGSIRLQEMLLTSDESPERSAGLLRQEIVNELKSVHGSLRLGDITSFVAVGGDARFAARQIGRATAVANLLTVTEHEFDKFVARCLRHSPGELAKKYSLPFADAETLNPALLVYQLLLRKTRAKEMVVSSASMRDGLLIELAQGADPGSNGAVQTGVIRSAIAIAQRYRADLSHAQTVADFAAWLFSQLQSDHGLGPRHQLLLKVAALLHEVGGVVSSRAHHKHSYYLIRNSEVFGLSRVEIEIVAHVARYHRGAMPKPSHAEYVNLPRESRMTVNQLAALLRVADALARGTLERISDLQLERHGDELIVGVPAGLDLLLERRSIANKGNLFEDVYGMRIRLEES